ncbi:MAG: hypothetical protein LBN36_08350 [Clostridiales Family XIII bacterium]|nr:hypothetical protein [Clostridiales Family XIII bacterium]
MIYKKNFRPVTASLVCLVLLFASFSGCALIVNEPEDDGADLLSYDFSVFFGSADDPVKISALIDRYAAENGILVNPIFTEEEDDDELTLLRMLDSSNPPAAFVLKEDSGAENTDDIDQYIGVYPGAENHRSQPYLFEGRGFAADKRLFEEIAGLDYADALIRDIREADWEEWKRFVIVMNAWIRDIPIPETPVASPAAVVSIPTTFTLGGVVYDLPSEKGTVAAALNGVYAVAGGDASYYGHELLARTLCTSDLDAWEEARTLTTPQAIEVITPGLTAYVDVIDLLTCSIAGKYAAGVRGKDFITDTAYSREDALEIFTRGHAVFTAVNVSDYEVLRNENAEMAENMILFPQKFPYREYGLPENPPGSTVRANSAIPLSVTHSFCLNKETGAADRSAAEDFLEWFSDAARRFDNPLESAARDYFSAGKILPYDLSENAVLSAEYESIIFSGSGVAAYLINNNWNDPLRGELTDMLFAAWYSQ